MIRSLIATACLAALPVLAQTPAKPASAAKPAPAATPAKPAASAKPAAPAAKTSAAAPAKHTPAKAVPSKSRTEIKTTAKNVAAGIEAAEAALTPAELAIADRVYTGRLPCELGNTVVLEADGKSPGYFNLALNHFKFRMFPVVTSTGAIRLEDQKAGAVWLQLGNKSMLMDQIHGKRLADECTSPQQTSTAAAMRAAPAQNLLDAPTNPAPANPAPTSPAPTKR